jgi:hypothetical protein
MHVAAREFIAKSLADFGDITGDVVEFGSRNANGGVRDLFPNAKSYTGIDSAQGPGVDLVADAAQWHATQGYACVISTETLEHARDWRQIIIAGAAALAPDGIMLITCATDGRAPHSATIPNSRPAPGEYYGNVRQKDLDALVGQLGLQADITVNQQNHDLYAILRPKPPATEGLQVIGAGFWRTATVSLKVALEQLTDRPSHHMSELVIHPYQTQGWLRAVRGQPPQWSVLLHGYGSTLDWPSMAFWRELRQAYPGALVLLSARDPAEWWQSISKTVLLSAPTAAATPWDELVLALFAHHFVGRHPTRAQAINFYNAHNAAVRVATPPNRLLQWQPADGWLPLCRALHKPVPTEAFPHKNSTAEYQRNHAIAPA